MFFFISFFYLFKSASVVDQARKKTLVDMEALGLSRRDFLPTRDFRVSRATFVPIADPESPECSKMWGHVRIPIPETTISYPGRRVRIGTIFTGLGL